MIGPWWEREGAFWHPGRFVNPWGQVAALPPYLERGEGGEFDGRLGVALDTSMCETFLAPEEALEYARRITRVAKQAIKAEERAGLRSDPAGRV